MQTSNYNIFNTCPYTNGAGVFMARGMYASFNPAANYNDLLICIPELGSYKKGGNPLADEWNDVQTLTILEQLKNSQISISPNPSTGILKLVYKLEKNQTAQITISDLIGKTVKIIDLDNANFYQTIDLSCCQNGLYIYNYTINRKLVESSKIQISK